MTPLAMYLTKQLIAPRKDRRDSWADDQQRAVLRTKLTDIHCFEITEVLGLMREVHDALDAKGKDEFYNTMGKFGFLPAPKTWIEWRMRDGTRQSVHLEQIDETATPSNDATIAINWFCRESSAYVGALTSDHRSILVSQAHPNLPPRFVGLNKNGWRLVFTLSSLALIMINSPRIIGRKQHMPHVGLERQLTRGLAGGKFPLHAWTEIKLQVAKPIEIDDGEPHEAHLTGRRALHFVRKHIRIRLGQLEYVSAHWRGDPSIGIKRSRYTVVP